MCTPKYNKEEEESSYYSCKYLCVLKNMLAASVGAHPPLAFSLGPLQMQLSLHYDETYHEVKYGNKGLPDIDSKMRMDINMAPIAALLHTSVLIRGHGRFVLWALCPP